MPVARRRAADHRRRARRGRARLRARGDDRARRPPDLDPAGQEPGGRQRGPAHARARGRRARPVRRAQRPHRRRPRRLVGVGRRLGDARPARRAHDLLGHARRRARAADEVRGRADRPPARRRGARDRARPRARGRPRRRSTPSPPTPRCSSCAGCSPSAARPGSTGDERVVWHDVECGGYTADLPLWRELADAEAGPVLDVGAGAGRVALDLARAGHDVTALDLDPELLAELRARAGREGLAVRTEQADAAGFELAGPPFGLIAGPDADDPAAARPRGPRRLPRLRARAPREPAGSWRSPSAEELEPFEADIAAPAAARHRRARRLALPLVPGRDPAARRPRRARARARADRARRHAPRARTTRSRSATLSAADLEAEGRAAGLRPEPRARDRRDRRPRRLDGGDAAWLRASCGSARCIRTS